MSSVALSVLSHHCHHRYLDSRVTKTMIPLLIIISISCGDRSPFGSPLWADLGLEWGFALAGQNSVCERGPCVEFSLCKLPPGRSTQPSTFLCCLRSSFFRFQFSHHGFFTHSGQKRPARWHGALRGALLQQVGCLRFMTASLMVEMRSNLLTIGPGL